MEVLGVNAAFWHGRRVFVTGDTGFKGFWLSEWLTQLGSEVVGAALPAEVPGLYSALHAGRWQHHDIDLRKARPIADLITASTPEIVFHLAAQPLVRAAHADPVDTFAVNVMGTAHVLEACRQRPPRAIVVITTDKCYENSEAGYAFRESDPLGGHEPYSASKAAAEHVCTAYRNSYLLPGRTGLATARAGNVIGAGDYAADRILPDAIRAHRQGQPLRVRNPAAVRPWQHVLEPLAGYLTLAERLHEDPEAYSSGWNFGPDLRDCLTVRQLLARWQELWPEWHGWEAVAEAGPAESKLLRLDWTRAHARLGWSPRLGLDTALRWTLDGYQQLIAAPGSATWMHRQISEYLQNPPPK